MKRLFVAILALIISGAAAEREGSTHEASTNFDRENVVPFLERATTLFESGFGPTEVKKVAAMMKVMKLDEEKELTFSVKFRGKLVPLRVRLFMDDVDAFDLYAFSSAEAASALMELMKKFAAEKGM